MFLYGPGDRQGGTAGVEILSEGPEMHVLVEYDEACTSGLAREAPDMNSTREVR